MTTISKQIAASGDDLRWYTAVNDFFNTNEAVITWPFAASGYADGALVARFTGIQFDTTPTVTSAVLTFQSSDTSNTAGTKDLTIKAYKADNPSAPTTLGQAETANGSLTTASTAWTLPNTTINTDFDSPNFMAVVQEIADAYDYVGSAKAMVFQLKSAAGNSTAGRNVKSYDTSAATGPRLTIIYNAAADSTPPVVSNVSSTYQLPTGFVVALQTGEASTATYVAYGLDGQALSSSSPAIDDTAFTTGTRSVGVGGLQPSTAYDFTPHAQDAALNNSVYATVHDVATIARRASLVLCIGDSITEGQDVATNSKWTKLLQDDLSTGAWVFNFGIGGQSCTDWSPTVSGGKKLTTRFGTPFHQGSGRNIVCYMASGNGGNNSGEYDAYVASVSALRSAGFTVIGSTVPPRSGTDYDNINTPLRANWQSIGLFALIDIDTVAELTDATNATYYGDGTHWTAAAAAIYEPLILAQVQAAIAVSLGNIAIRRHRLLVA